jgi:hypothetical protein
MNYFRSFLINTLTVFFIDRVAPGIEVALYEQVPNIGADLLFSILVGFFNASVFPFLAILELNPTVKKIIAITGVISIAGFTIISIVPFGVRVTSVLGAILGAGTVWAIAALTNYLEFKRDKHILK